MTSSRDLAVGEVPFGTRPALIVVDMSLGFTTPESPLGGNYDKEVEATCELLSVFRQKAWPVVFSTVVYHDSSSASVFRQHLPDLNMLKPNSRWIEIDPRLGPQPAEYTVEKTLPSAFFATELANVLRQQKIDSVVVVGLTTSGCVRATAVDALQHNLRVWLVPEACGDRNTHAHTANLHDIAAKYADVVPLEQCISRLNLLAK